MRKMKLFWGMIRLALLPFACDTLEDDVVPANDLAAINESSDAFNNTYNSTGGELLIDLLHGVKASQNVRIALEKAPTKGTAELLDAGTLRYVPFPEFTTGKDWMVVALSNGTSSRQDTIEVVMNPLRDTVLVDTVIVNTDTVRHDSTCTFRINADSLAFSPDTLAANSDTFYLDVLANDQLCGSSYQLTLPDAEANLTVSGRNIAYYSPNRQDIYFRYQVCSDSLNQCYDAYASVTFRVCTPYLLPDSVSISRRAMVSDTVSINVRWNDQVCGDDSVQIYQQPTTGEAWVENNYIIYQYPAAPEAFSTSLIYGYGAPPPASEDTDGRQATLYIKVDD